MIKGEVSVQAKLGVFDIEVKDPKFYAPKVGSVKKNGNKIAKIQYDDSEESRYFAKAEYMDKDGPEIYHIIKLDKNFFIELELNQDVAELTLLHEIGHLEKGHLSYDNHSFNEEIEADQFALSVLGKKEFIKRYKMMNKLLRKGKFTIDEEVTKKYIRHNKNKIRNMFCIIYNICRKKK